MSEHFTKPNEVQTGSLSIPVAGNNYHYNVIFEPDGTGRVEEDSTTSPEIQLFTHTLDLTALRRQFTDPKAQVEQLDKYFWAEVNHQLEEPLFAYFWQYPDLENHELEFTSGAREEFDRLMRLFLLTEPGLDEVETSTVTVYSATEQNRPYLERRWDYSSDRLRRLLALAARQNRPYGYLYEYDDSGYRFTPQSMNYDIYELFNEVSARERWQPGTICANGW